MLKVSTSVGIALLISACGCTEVDPTRPTPSAATTARARITAYLPESDTRTNRVSSADVEAMTLLIEWANGRTPVIAMFQNNPGQFQVIVEGLPVNTPCSATVQGLSDAGEVLFSGEATGIIFPPDEVLEVAINLVARDDGMDEGTGPRIQTVLRPAEDIPAGMIVDLGFVVTDPDDDRLTFELTTTSSGSFSVSSGEIDLNQGVGELQVQFTAPAEIGDASITLRIVDSADLAASFTFSISVVLPESGTAPGSAGFATNFPPTILEVRATELPKLGMIELSAVAEDPAGEALFYDWSIFGTPYATGNPITLPSGSGVVEVTLTVSDSGAASTSMLFAVDTSATSLESLPLQNRPPRIVTAVQSDQDVSFGDQVTLLVYATDPDGDALNVEWEADHGSVVSMGGGAVDQLQYFSARWNAAEDEGTAYVTVSVSDPRLSSATFTFSIVQVLGRVAVIADAGRDSEGFVSSSGTLDGSGSSSADGIITDYLWEQLAGPQSTIDAPASPVTDVYFAVAGTYVFQLTVWNINNTHADTMEVRVIDPTVFSYVDADIDETGIIYFLDTATDRVRRFDTTIDQFLPSFQTASGLRRFAVAPAGDEVYVGFDGGRMDRIDTSTSESSFFSAAPSSVLRMAIVGDYVFVIDSSGAWETHSLYSRLTSTRTFSDDWRHNSSGVAYAPSLARVFTFRDGTSPNDIIRTDVDLVNGTLSGDVDSPYHGDYVFIHPMRLFPDESRIAVASGVFFDTADLTYAGSIGMHYEDLRFLGNRVYVLDDIGTRSAVIEMDLGFNILASSVYDGAPLNLFATDDSLYLVTQPAENRIGIQRIVQVP